MLLKIHARLDYKLEADTTILLQLEAAALADQRILDASTEVRNAEFFARVPAEEGVGARSWIRVRDRFLCDYRARVEIDRPKVELRALAPVPSHELPGEVVKYIFGSRFIASDKFEVFVESEFAGSGGGARIALMRDWIEANLDYVPGSSDAMTTALDTFVQRQGICRDYAHLMIAFARASRIPARMVSVYAPSVEPPDFHAVAEVYLDGGWQLVDATGMAEPGEMARIGVGRDAADIAFMTAQGKVELSAQSVSVKQG